jgi:hypothetical protein
LLSEILAKIKGVKPGIKTETVAAWVRFEVVADGGGETPHYTWLRNGAPIPGAPDAPKFSTNILLPADAISVRVANSVGWVDAAPLVMDATLPPPPEIILQPALLELRAGQTSVLRVSIKSDSILTFQWYKNDVLIPKAVLDKYTLTGGGGAAGRYKVVVTTTDTGRAAESTEVEVRVVE